MPAGATSHLRSLHARPPMPVRAKGRKRRFASGPARATPSSPDAGSLAAARPARSIAPSARRARPADRPLSTILGRSARLGRLAQLVERLPYKQEVACSSQAPPTEEGTANRSSLKRLSEWFPGWASELGIKLGAVSAATLIAFRVDESHARRGARLGGDRGGQPGCGVCAGLRADEWRRDGRGGGAARAAREGRRADLRASRTGLRL